MADQAAPRKRGWEKPEVTAKLLRGASADDDKEQQQQQKKKNPEGGTVLTVGKGKGLDMAEPSGKKAQHTQSNTTSSSSTATATVTAAKADMPEDKPEDKESNDWETVSSTTASKKKPKQRNRKKGNKQHGKYRCHTLVADTAAFIKNAPLFTLAQRIVTVPEVLREIKDEDTRRRIQTLPYEIEVRQPSQAAMAAMSSFAKKTGDLRVLSAADLRVLALAYMMEVEAHGSDKHLNTEPKRVRCSA